MAWFPSTFTFFINIPSPFTRIEGDGAKGPSTLARGDFVTSPAANSALILNLAPIRFSAETVEVGRLPYTDEETYAALRQMHRDTHVFRFDQRDGQIANVTLAPGTRPLGECRAEPVANHLLLLGKAVQQSLLQWLAQRFTIVHRARPVSFWGGATRSRLLSRAIDESGLEPREGLEILVRYTLDTRVLERPEEGSTTLALVIDLSTSNVIDIPAGQLAEAGVNLVGRYVCRPEPAEEAEPWYRPRLETLGCVSEVLDDELLLTDAVGVDRVRADQAYLEPRHENLDAVVTVLYGKNADRILRRASELRAPHASANGKLQVIRQTLTTLRREHELRVAGSLVAAIDELLISGHKGFPEEISTSRPTMLFGDGLQTSRVPDEGVQRWGPYKYMHNEQNEPVIVVVCEAAHRGRMEQFVELLRSGFPDADWRKATHGPEPRPNPFAGGLVGKFRLRRVSYEWEEVQSPTAEAYGAAAERALRRLPTPPALALVQIRKDFTILRGDQNPYFVGKAAFMMGGVPVQNVRIESVEAHDGQLPYILNNLALASYAKMRGVPWVISTRAPASHELVVGMGYAEVSDRRLGDRTRYVGITTLFQGDGRYVVWGLTREVEFATYVDALLESLRTTVRYVSDSHGWQPGDQVRLIFHVYKHLKHVEMDAIQELVKTMLAEKYRVEFAFLDISQYHVYQLFDPNSKGRTFWSPSAGRRKKGVGVPDRGICLQLSRRTALLHLTGPAELKTDQQGLPRPLLVDVHPRSDFTDLAYLARQIYHFTYVSWRSFFPATEPVTISYSRLIAKALANLRNVTGWNSSVLTVGSLRDGKWFL